jgi:TonB-linked SusC/RagA family outer membrane protein
MRIWCSILVVSLIAIFAVPTSAQQRATVTGRVTDAMTQTPLESAQVSIEGTNFGVLANAEGRFLILNVPAGTHTLRATMIGYGPVTQEFTVEAGGTASVNFTMSPSALQLDALVVTATGQQRKREIGNAIGTIDAAAILEVAPVNNMADLLQGRTAGVQINNASGTSGAGSRIRIRGASSISLSNEPLIYVDGIRVDNAQSNLGAGGGAVGGQDSSRLLDFNPEDIESIEIVKGPAAATLYGTEAANGVIRITTKKGRPGEVRWTAWAETGIINEPNTYPLNYSGLGAPGGSFATRCTLDAVDQGLCTQTGLRTFQVLEDPILTPISDGNRNQIGISVQGGTDRINYYVSGEIENETGPYSLPQVDREDLITRGVPITSEVERPNQLGRKNLRVNLNSQLTDKVTMALRMGYLQSHFAFLGNDNNSFGLLPSAYLGSSDKEDPWGFQAPAQLFGRTLYQNVQRFTTGTTLTYQPVEWLSMRGTGGLDYTSRNDVSFFARDIGVPGDRNTGRKDTGFTNTWQYTVDLSGTAAFDLTSSVTSSTTLGAQYFRNLFLGTNAWGLDIVNGAASIGAAAETFSNEFQTETKTAGIFIDQQFGLNDRLFVNFAIRADDNSAFGQDFDLITYPKAAVSWVASEEGFFPDIGFLDVLKLRGAWGRSGLQPGSNAAIKTLAANAITTTDDETGSGVAIGEVGNVNLQPERSSEIELGFDAEMWNGRASIEFTYYDKTTDGALIRLPLAPSLGASATRWVNIGDVENKGWEVGINAALLTSDNVSWDVTVSGSINKNKLLTLGPDTDPIGSQTRFVPGFPLGGQWAKPITGFNDADGNGILNASEITVGDTLEFVGSGLPEQQLSITTSITLFKNLRIYGLLDFRGDYVTYNNTERFRCRFRICEAINDPNTPIAEQARAVSAVYHPDRSVWGYMEDGSFWKLRELSLSYKLPGSLTDKMRTRNASITVTGRNLFTWTDYTGVDPEVNWSGSTANFGTNDFLTQPPVRYFTIRFNFGF